VKGHPVGQGWVLLQTYRTSDLPRSICVRYSDRQLILSFWKYDTRKRESGDASVDWEMTLEVMLPHHAVVKLNSVYTDGMLAQLSEHLDPGKDLR